MTYYLVDTENTGSVSWSRLITEDRNHVKIFIFFTDNSPKVPWEFLFEKLFNMVLEGYYIRGIECNSGQAKRNALDFQLVCYLGQLTAKDRDKKRSYVIVSNDQGYDPVIAMLRCQGYYVKRMNATNSNHL